MTACASDYAGMQRINPDCNIESIRPKGMKTGWFTAVIDVMGHHLSGLLFVKQLPEGAHRILFTAETGVTFFDLEFRADDTFIVHRIIPQMNKKAVVGLLRSDLALLLAKPFRNSSLDFYLLNDSIFAGVGQKKEIAYFITDKDCASLQRFEVGSRRKRKVTVVFSGDSAEPDEVEIRHHTFNMRIRLRKLKRE